MFRYLPEQASEIAPKVDWLNYFILDLSLFFTVAIVGVMLYFAFKYRAKGGVHHETPRIEGSHYLEGVWTLLPTVVCIVIAVYGIQLYSDLREVPKDALVINAIGSKWKWDFQYANGKQTTGEAVIPVDTPIQFVISGKDVLHSFFIPAMRVKADAVEGRYSYVTFKPVKTGDYNIFCAEYCGTYHSGMLAKLRVVSKEEYQRWLNDNSDQLKLTPADRGRDIYTQNCKVCHSVDGSTLVGPSFLKIYGRHETFDDGSEADVEENYIKESILNPNAKIVKGFTRPSPMPSFEGQLNDKIDLIIAFMKSLDGTSPAGNAPSQFSFAKAGANPNATPAERGKELYMSKTCVGCHSLDGTKVVGPTFKGVYGRSEALSDGTQVTVDDAYIKESIINPTAKIVQGFNPLMPPTLKDSLTDQDISDLIEFIKTVK